MVVDDGCVLDGVAPGSFRLGHEDDVDFEANGNESVVLGEELCGFIVGVESSQGILAVVAMSLRA